MSMNINIYFLLKVFSVYFYNRPNLINNYVNYIRVDPVGGCIVHVWVHPAWPVFFCVPLPDGMRCCFAYHSVCAPRTPRGTAGRSHSELVAGTASHRCQPQT
jgi:hypothetical protein